MEVRIKNFELSIENTKDKNSIIINKKNRKLYPFIDNIKYFNFKNEKIFVLQELDVWSSTYYFPIVFQYKYNKKNFPKIYWNDLEDKLKNVIKKYKNYEIEDVSVPSAPDTSKFISIQRGDLEYTKKYTKWGGQYSTDKYFIHFIKIGTALKSKLPNEFWNDLMEIYTNALLTGLTLNNRKPVLDIVEGTAFFGVGLR